MILKHLMSGNTEENISKTEMDPFKSEQNADILIA